MSCCANCCCQPYGMSHCRRLLHFLIGQHTGALCVETSGCCDTRPQNSSNQTCGLSTVLTSNPWITGYEESCRNMFIRNTDGHWMLSISWGYKQTERWCNMYFTRYGNNIGYTIIWSGIHECIPIPLQTML